MYVVLSRGIPPNSRQQILKPLPIIFADTDLDGSSFSSFIIATDSHDIKDRFDRTQERLRTHQPVLVGHNMFTDLVYFYRSFVGPLPDTLEEFCEAIHELFPQIVDTKYLATHAEGDLNASPTLQEIAEKLEKQPLPDIGESMRAIILRYSSDPVRGNAC